MKRLWMLTILMIVLAGCGGSTAPGGGQCNKGLCVKIEVAEPIRWGEPIVVTVTVTAERDISNLQVSLTLYPPVSMEDQRKWIEEGTRANVSLTANKPLAIARKVYFPAEGMFELMAGVYTPNLPYVSDSVRIYLGREGGKVYYSGTPVPTPPLGGVVMGRVRTSEGVDCSPGPCLTIRVVEPVRWGEPVRVLLQIEGRKEESVMLLPSGKEITIPADFPQLGLTFSSPDPSVQIKPEEGINALWVNPNTWLPKRGRTIVRPGNSQDTERYVHQTMIWTDVSGFGPNSAYEHDFFLNNYDGKTYLSRAQWPNGIPKVIYWGSNLPRAYLDTRFSDPKEEVAYPCCKFTENGNVTPGRQAPGIRSPFSSRPRR